METNFEFDESNATMTITMTVEEWALLKDQLCIVKEWPAYGLLAAISGLLEKATAE